MFLVMNLFKLNAYYFNGLFIFLLLVLVFLYVFWIQSFCRYVICKYFFTVNCFNFLNAVFQKTEVLNLDEFQCITFLVCVCVCVYHDWHHILRIQVWCMRQVLRAGALGWHRGMGWGGRWEGGSGWGIHVNPWLIHVNIRQKPLQYCKVISLQLIKVNGQKQKQRV